MDRALKQPWAEIYDQLEQDFIAVEDAVYSQQGSGDEDDEHKALSLLGMAMRAARSSQGMKQCLNRVQQGKAKLVIAAGDASDNTKKKFRDKCATYNVKLVEALTG